MKEKCKNCGEIENGSIIQVDENMSCVQCHKKLTPVFDPIDIVYIKYRDELTDITAKHYGKTVTIETKGGDMEFVFKGSKIETVKKVCESILRLIEQK